jgi:hypothetical protein
MSYIPARLSNLRTKPVASAPVTQAIDEAFAGLTDPQRYGLLAVRGGRASAELRAIMDAMGWPPPSRDDWRVLRINGFVRRRADDLLHDLLPKGLTAAQAISRDLCRKFGVHVLTVHERRPGVARRGVCSCGLLDHAELQACGTVEVAFTHHLQRMNVDPGGYGSERRMNDIFDQVARDAADARARFTQPQPGRATLPGSTHLPGQAGAAAPSAAPVSLTEAAHG